MENGQVAGGVKPRVASRNWTYSGRDVARVGGEGEGVCHLSAAAIRASHSESKVRRGRSMKKLLAGAVMAVWLAPLGVVAQERAGDAALGALSGAVVLGPIGAVAGAVVGYTAGPHIARSWGLRRSSAHGGRRVARQEAGAAVSDNQPAPRSQASMSAPAPRRSPAYAGPPAQGFD